MDTTAQEQPRAKRRVYTVAQRVALVKKAKSLMRREGIKAEEASQRLGFHWSNFYRWQNEGKHKRRTPRHYAARKAANNGAAVGSAEEGTLFNELLSLPQRLGKVEATLAALLKALGTSPQELAP